MVSTTTSASTGTTAKRSTGAHTTQLARNPEKKAGQRFKNLRHMNNFAKFARREPAPDPSAIDLRAPEEWARSEKNQTAPKLQATSPRDSGSDSWLFIPETEKEKQQNTAENQIRSRPSLSKNGSRAGSPIQPESIRQDTISARRMSMESSKTPAMIPSYSTNQVPPRPVITARNGRTWKSGDVVVNLRFGKSSQTP